jgi:hypothetical protein
MQFRTSYTKTAHDLLLVPPLPQLKETKATDDGHDKHIKHHWDILQ